jgi:hypothetical protein
LENWRNNCVRTSFVPIRTYMNHAQYIIILGINLENMGERVRDVPTARLKQFPSSSMLQVISMWPPPVNYRWCSSGMMIVRMYQCA